MPDDDELLPTPTEVVVVLDEIDSRIWTENLPAPIPPPDQVATREWLPPPG